MRRATAALLLTATVAGNEFVPNGSAACPCIDPWLNINSLGANAPRAVGVHDCDIERDGDRFCFPTSYGSHGCAAYDANLTPECTRSDSPPAWCTNMWCYVDLANCNRSFVSSPFFSDVRMNLTCDGCGDSCKDSLALSYTTCGYLDKYASSREGVRNSLQRFAASQPNGKLRVSFPDDSSSQYTVVGQNPYPPGGQRSGVKVEPGKGVGGTGRSGSILVFFAEIFRQYNVSWVHVPISERSRAFAPLSSYSACTHDVAIGHTDMCWGNFWATSERRQMVTFSSAMYEDEFFVIVPLGKADNSLWTSITKPFDPFTPSLWIMIFCVFGTVGVTLTWENYSHESWWTFATQMMPIAILKGLNAYNLGEVQVKYRTSGSWLTAFFVGFTFQVLITGYTAVVTNTLLTAGTTKVSSFEETINRGLRICVSSPMIPGLVAQYPKMAPLIVEMKNGATLAGMDEDLCDAAIIQEDAWRGARYFGQTLACSTKGRLRETVTILANSIPIRKEIEQAVSYAITREVEAGTYIRLRDEARRNYTYGLCVEAETHRGRSQFGLEDLGGPLMFLGCAAFISVLITRFGMVSARAADRIKERLDKDHDGNVTGAEVVHAVVDSVIHLGHHAEQVRGNMRNSLYGDHPRISVLNKRIRKQSLQLNDALSLCDPSGERETAGILLNI
ncbi:hypothetical protein AB1Y20_017451 [Prymnesium parvum]|uniref:EF-hand domain-containing protein n=1 Tax=Prymnesium parvum TaxID=97485 RepID=A0AB34JND7_PRYPA